MKENKQGNKKAHPQQDNSNKEKDLTAKKPQSSFGNPFFANKKDDTQQNNDNIQPEVSQEQLQQEDAEKIKLKEDLEKLNNQYIRLAADFDNFRKRTDLEKQDMFKHGTMNTIKVLLPTLDALDRAYLAFQTMDDPEKLKDSFNVLYRKMQESITAMKVDKIKTAGEMFDPNYHEAVMQEETTEYPDCGIMLELQTGYIYEDKVIRPSMVKVASNPEGASVQSCEIKDPQQEL